MMKSLARLASFVALALCVPAFAAAADPPPNVIVIYTDDQGSVDMGAYGTKDIETPNMDRLAAGGVRFTQMLAPAPVCSPSRAGLMTGRVPQRAGVPGNVPSHHGGAGMPSEQITMAELFKGAGYATAHIGKWHLGYTPETMPNAQGFDYSFGHMGGCIDNFSHFFYWNGPNRHDLWRNGEEIHEPGQFFPALMVREASAFIQKNRAKPFFIYCAFNVPHYPYQGTPEWLAHYDEAGVAYPRNLYNAFVSTVDAQIGALLDRLEALGLRENTIVVLQSDHGHSTEERAHHGGGNAGPYRGAKFSLFEGGLRVPSAICWPGGGARVPAGAVRGQFATGCDWFPTLAALCGIALPAGHTIDGKDISGILAKADAPSPHAEFHWASGGQWAVREGPWKLLNNPKDTAAQKGDPAPDKVFLANLDDDIGEQKNLAAENPEIVARLKAKHEAWMAGLK